MNPFEQVKKWLLDRTITEEVLKKYNITWNGKIVIPVYDECGKFLYNKYRRSPLVNTGDRYIYDRGSHYTLYGTQFIDKTKPVILCEGELDVLALVAHGFQAVTSTGGCKSFKDEWLKFLTMPVYICYDNDSAGRNGALNIHYKIPNSKIVNIPIKKDITDYFVLGNKKEDFEKLLLGAMEYPKQKIKHIDFKKDNTKYDDVKKIPITNFLKFNNQNKICCLWHNEKEPSLTYYPETNSCYCYGCGKNYDVINVIMNLNNFSFKEAVDFLKKN